MKGDYHSPYPRERTHLRQKKKLAHSYLNVYTNTVGPCTHIVVSVLPGAAVDPRKRRGTYQMSYQIIVVGWDYDDAAPPLGRSRG